MFIRSLFIFAAALLLFPFSLWAEIKPKYLFLLIGDGMGQNSVNLYRQQMDKTSFDRLGTPVLMGTNNFKGTTTDSAASGTALACGIKTNNGALGVDEKGTPVMSLAKILQKRGMKIGIISSVGINDATPAAHYANRLSRKDRSGTFSDLMASGFDFFGVSYYMKPAELQEKDLFTMLKRNKYTVIKRESLDKVKKEDKTFYISYTGTSDRKRFQTPKVSLADVTKKAIEVLDNPNGFFMMVEGGAIDHYNHRNESAGMINEMIEFDKVIATVLDFAQAHPEETLVIVTADHETGGLTLTGKAPKDFWKKQPASYNTIEYQLKKMLQAKKSKEELIAYTCQSVGVENISGDAKKKIEAAAERFISGKKTEKGSMYGKYNPLILAVFSERDARNNIKYTTYGHTGEKVFAFAVGNGAKLFTEPLENSDIPRRISIAAAGRDLLEENKGVYPFPNVPDQNHFSIQSVSKDTIVCRCNPGEAKKLDITLTGNNYSEKRSISSAAARITFNNLAPDTEYTLTAGDKSFKLRTLPELKNVLVKGAVLADPHTSTRPNNPLHRLHSRSAELLANAHKYFDDKKIDVLLVPGDITDKSTPGEFMAFEKCFEKTAYKVITTPGNHDYLTRENAKYYNRTFKKPASYYDINGIQIVSLNTWDGKLNKPENIQVIEKLDITRPAIIQTHHQLKKSNIIIKDKNAAITDGNTPQAKAMLDKISKSRAVVLAGHKNSAEKITLDGGKVIQLNCPQTTQYPCGYLMFEANHEGIALWFVPSAGVKLEEYSRRLAPHSTREKFALPYWNAFYKW